MADYRIEYTYTYSGVLTEARLTEIKTLIEETKMSDACKLIMQYMGLPLHLANSVRHAIMDGNFEKLPE